MKKILDVTEKYISLFSCSFLHSKMFAFKNEIQKKKALGYASKIGFCSFVSGAAVRRMGFCETQSSLTFVLFRNLTHPIYISFQWCFQ